MRETDREEFNAVMCDARDAIGQGDRFTEGALELIFASLQDLELNAIKQALVRHINDPKNGKWRPNAGYIREQLERRQPLLWVSADEAWALAPKIEGQPAITNSIAVQALAVAQPQIDAGDMIAARMAFKGTYDRLVAMAKLERRSPEYFLSPGGTYEEQEAMREQGRNQGLLPPAKVPNQALLQGPSAAGKARIAALLQDLKPKMIGGSDE